MPLIKLLGENYAKGFVRGFAKKDCKADSASWHPVSRWLFIKSGIDL